MQTDQTAAKARDTLPLKISAAMAFGLAGLTAAIFGISHANAQSAPNGEQLFLSVGCAGCHSTDGHGSLGGDAPPLAGDGNLGDTQLVIHQILNGGGAMPAFATQLSDDQIAAIANYIRHAWGNNYDPTLTAADVTPLRN